VAAINFGERVVATDPSSLFTVTCEECPPGAPVSGVSAVFTLMEVQVGVVYIVLEIAEQDAHATLRIDIPAGVTTDLAGNPCTAANVTVSYVPTPAVAKDLGNAMACIFGGVWPVAIVGSLFGAVPAFSVAAVSNRVVVTSLIAGLPIITMPPTYTSFSQPLNFIKLDQK